MTKDEIKKLVNSINSILDSKYGEIVKPKINTEVNSFGELFRLMRRWHIFVNHYKYLHL